MDIRTAEITLVTHLSGGSDWVSEMDVTKAVRKDPFTFLVKQVEMERRLAESRDLITNSCTGTLRIQYTNGSYAKLEYTG